MKNKWKIFLATALAVAALVGVSVFIAADRREVWGHTAVSYTHLTLPTTPYV